MTTTALRRCRIGALAIAAALLISSPHFASACVAAGDRTFPAMILLPQVAPADQIYVTPATQPGSEGRSTDVAVNFAKTLTERLGVRFEEDYTWLGRNGASTVTGWQNLQMVTQYLAILEPAHEALLTLGVNREWGGTGTRRVGASPKGATAPTVHSVQHILTDRLQLTNQPFGLCLALDHELAVSGLAAIMRKARVSTISATPRSRLARPRPWRAARSISTQTEEVTVAPNARIPRSINPHTEVAVIVQEGRLDALLGRERITIVPGDTLLAPAGTAHGFLNRYEDPARVLFVFPSHQVEQVRVSIPGTTTGFPSERGLSGYESPQDRPLEKRS